jgi:hypothetical protein
MTVAELIAELQLLVAEGLGDATVIVREPETDSHYEQDREVSAVMAQPQYTNQPHVLID